MSVLVVFSQSRLVLFLRLPKKRLLTFQRKIVALILLTFLFLTFLLLVLIRFFALFSLVLLMLITLYVNQMKFFSMLNKLQKRLNKPVRVYYVLSLNDKTFEFDSKKKMYSYIELYSHNNTIYNIGMFKFKVYPIQ